MKLTIFTPTYNRAGYLLRVYESLQQQTYRDFEWLIIDDGSMDKTRETVATLPKTDFPVRYYSKENGGKHTAWNLALEKAEGDWLLCVDADDRLHPQALEHLWGFIETTDTGVVAYKCDEQGKLLSASFPTAVKSCKFSDLALHYGCSGEFTLVYPTHILRQYPFPVFAGERFLGETVLYDRLDRVCPVKPLAQVITVCEYLPDGYSWNFGRLLKENPSGFCLYFLQRIDLQPGAVSRLIHAGKYWCFRWISGNRTLRYKGKHKVLTALAVLPGFAFRIYYKLIRKF